MPKKKNPVPLPKQSKKVAVDLPSTIGPNSPLKKELTSKLKQTPEEKVTADVEHPDEAIESLKRVLRGIQTGEDISADEPLIARLIANQEARAKVINSLVMTHDYERLVKFIETRKKMDKALIEHASKAELPPAVLIGIYKMMTLEVEDISSRMRAQMMGHEDMMNLLQKVNWATSVSDNDLASKFTGTSTQGREMIRKMAVRLRKAAEQSTKT